MQYISTKTLYKNMGKTVGWWTIQVMAEGVNAEHSAQLRITYAKSATGAVTEKFVAIEGKNIGRTNETTPALQALSEAESRWKKQLDKGYVELEADATAPKTNASGKKMPMLATPIEKVKEESIDWDNAYLQPKLDGHRSMNDEGLYSRNGKAINLPHIANAIKALGLDELLMDGELYVHGINLQDLGSLIKKPREESEVLEYHVYDLVADLPFAQRHTLLANHLGAGPFRVQYGQPPVQIVVGGQAVKSPLRLVPTIKVDSMEAAKAAHQVNLENGYEGSILRHGLAGYEDGKRTKALLKIKDFEDHEYKVVGWEAGAPNRTTDVEGNPMILRVPVWKLDNGKGRIFKATCVGDMFEKEKEYQVADSRIGTLRTIKHFGFTPDGIPNLPVDKGPREDV